MAKAHSKQNRAVNKATKTEHYYTVGYVPQNDKTTAPPAIHLKGQWLKAAGFDKGCTLTVTTPVPSSNSTSASKTSSVKLS
ncbi:SymE family type I addiction module toxin [Xenorhabdus sp. SF857]|uniref:SymE family type I addiction module toxin n=1 Tax=Xenorhabdus bakwenae TaxID=3026967 RepID=UPI002557D817|nr:SymE family type I addiction module toxin [Xenorhabdus sp. SF857]WFQ79113.1 SymE family type I addiction module toxin [Xenorhabdus sp. SF857]